MSRSPLRPRPWRERLALAGGSLLLAFAIGEVTVRLAGVEHEDGAFTLNGRLVSAPWPAAKHDELIARLRSRAPPFLVDDPLLGWALNPVDAGFHDSLYFTNDDGIRCGRERRRYAAEPAAGALRVVLLGDSFTYGEELPFEATWGAQLEQELARSRAAEVINLGVGGYGMDQALLRFRKQGAGLKPAVVVFGLQAENALRNLSVVRMFYFRASDFPFTKPRFVLRDGALELANSPALRPDELNRMLHDGSARDCPALVDDRFAAPFLVTDRFWRRSRFLSLVDSFASQAGAPSAESLCRDPACEGTGVALAILDAMRRDVEAAGARLVVVHLPTLWRDAAQWAPFLAQIEARQRVVATDAALRAGLLDRDLPLRNPDGTHYSAEACRIVAGVVAAELRAPR